MTDEMFWARVDKTGECWIWTGARNPNGYGVVRRRPKRWLVHAYAWTEEHGPVPEGLELDHLCRNRICVRPSHLEPVTHAENMRRAHEANGTGKYALSCPHGHPYSGDNVRVEKRGYRFCVTCRREQRAAYRARQKIGAAA